MVLTSGASQKPLIECSVLGVKKKSIFVTFHGSNAVLQFHLQRMVATCGQVPNTVKSKNKWQKACHSIESVYTVSLLPFEQKTKTQLVTV